MCYKWVEGNGDGEVGSCIVSWQLKITEDGEVSCIHLGATCIPAETTIQSSPCDLIYRQWQNMNVILKGGTIQMAATMVDPQPPQPLLFTRSLGGTWGECSGMRWG